MGRGYRLQVLSSTLFSLAFSPPSTFCRRFGTFLRHCLLTLALLLGLRPRFGFPPFCFRGAILAVLVSIGVERDIDDRESVWETHWLPSRSTNTNIQIFLFCNLLISIVSF